MCFSALALLSLLLQAEKLILTALEDARKVKKNYGRTAPGQSCSRVGGRAGRDLLLEAKMRKVVNLITPFTFCLPGGKPWNDDAGCIFCNALDSVLGANPTGAADFTRPKEKQNSELKSQGKYKSLFPGVICL